MRLTTASQRTKALSHAAMTAHQDFHSESRIECRTEPWESSSLAQNTHNVQKRPEAANRESRISRRGCQNKLEIGLENKRSSKIRP
jgi:hypothetical protein